MSSQSDIGERIHAVFQERGKARGAVSEEEIEEAHRFDGVDERFRNDFLRLVRNSLPSSTSDEDIEDRTHDTFITCWQGTSQANGPGQAVRFVQTVAKNKSIDAFRQRKRSGEEPLDESEQGQAGQPDTRLVIRDLYRVGQRALALLLEVGQPGRVERSNEFLSHRFSYDPLLDDPGPSFSDAQRKRAINRAQKSRSEGRKYLETLLLEHPGRFEDEERTLLSWILSTQKEMPQVSDEHQDERLEEEESR